MNRIVLAAGLALAQLFAVNAMAQSKGEADPAQSKAIPFKPATPEEKAAAKASRKAEGKVAAKSDKPSAEDETNKSLGKAKGATKEQRAEARQASAQSALKKGEISSGEKQGAGLAARAGPHFHGACRPGGTAGASCGASRAL